MKNNTERDAIIFNLWQGGYTYEQIASMKIQSFLSLKRIRNIIYGGKNRLSSENEREIYRIFRLKFLELQNVHDAITYTWNNQPSHTLHVHHIRKIINTQLKNRSIKTKNLLALPNGEMLSDEQKQGGAVRAHLRVRP